MGQEVVGLVVLVVAGAISGLFTQPMCLSSWAWESKWFVFSTLAYGILPWTLAGLTVESLFHVYGEAKLSAVLACAGLGFLWGVGSQLFGLGVEMVGSSLGFSIILGLTATLGSVVPLVLQHPDQVASTKGLCNLISLVVTVSGLGLVAWAGKLKEQAVCQAEYSVAILDEELRYDNSGAYRFSDQSSLSSTSSLQQPLPASRPPHEGPQKHPAVHNAGTKLGEPEECPSIPVHGVVRPPCWVGLSTCLASGLLSACLNFSVSFGEDIKHRAQVHGTSESMSSNAVAALGVSCGYIPNLVYCTYLLHRNGTWRDFSWAPMHAIASESEPPGWAHHGWAHQVRSLAVCLLMAVMWFGAFASYGVAADELGDLGTVLGWPLYINSMIVAANLAGFATGEWEAAPLKARKVMVIGLAVLCISICILGYGNVK